jgi:hypothetical protein
MSKAKAPADPVTAPVVCPIINSDRCEIDDLVVKHNAPVLAMCRKLIEAGYDQDRPLETYRGDTLRLRISSVCYGAKWTVEDNRVRTPTHARSWDRVASTGRASPVRPKDGPANPIPGYVP